MTDKPFLRRLPALLFRIATTALLLYAVLFSLAGTTALLFAYHAVMTPVRQVKALQSRNPAETAYMASYRTSLPAKDTLRHRFVPLDSISPLLRQAVLAAEDDGFYTHPGFDLAAIIDAMEFNRTQGEIKRGASTITQQLAKNLFLTQERSFDRKLRELAYTILLEKYLDKERILELYLNYAQWGKTIFGCEAAAQIYYRKSCRELGRKESARLAAVLAMPSRITPHANNSTFIAKRLFVIANNLFLHHKIDDSGFIALTGSPPPGTDSSETITTDGADSR